MCPIWSHAKQITRRTAREPRRFQRLPRFSLTASVHNNLGNLLSLNLQPRWLQQMEFGHSFDTVETQGRYRHTPTSRLYSRLPRSVPARCRDWPRSPALCPIESEVS